MKKYIVSLIVFITLVICAMYFVQNNTSIKPAGNNPVALKKLFAGNSVQAKAPKQEEVAKPIELTPEEKEAQRLALEKKKAEEELARQEAERLRQEQEALDAKFLEKNLVNAEAIPAKLFLDIRYATANNFTQKELYSSDKCYLQADTADALAQAAQYALEEDEPFYLCLYDCYRTLSAQQALWDAHPVPGQVAKPNTGSNHNRGTAVDLGPCDANGYPLAMPTQFDDFSAKAHAFAKDGVSEAAIKNRTALQRIMRKAGFTTIRKEWWHFNYKNAKKYPIVDLDFEIERPTVISEQTSASSEETSVVSEKPVVDSKEPNAVSENNSASSETPSASSEKPTVPSEKPSVAPTETSSNEKNDLPSQK